MGACAGTRSRNDNESERKQQEHKFRFSTSKRERIKLRAICYFEALHMNDEEDKEFTDIFYKGKVKRRGYPYDAVLKFREGDKMEIIPPGNIGDTVGWWKVKHSRSGKIGFVLRNRVVIEWNGRDEHNQTPSSTTIYDLPLEMVDIILKKSYLHWMSSSEESEEEVIRSLASVDYCFSEILTRKRFKTAIWGYCKDFLGKNKKRSAIIRNNRIYLSESINPTDELIHVLLSLNCITDKERHFIQRRRSERHKTAELLHVLRGADEIQFSNFVKGLRQTNQRTVARIIENGGGVIKFEFQTRGEMCAELMQTQLSRRRRKIEQLRDNKELISRFMGDDIDILDPQREKRTEIAWIWCHSKYALQKIQMLHNWNKLRDVFFETTQPSTSEEINIESNQFNKTVVAMQISINLTNIIKKRGHEEVYGVTKLRNEIYVLCQSTVVNVIRVYEDEAPFSLQSEIEIKEVKTPHDIGSSERDNCLYISDRELKCVWKITREIDDKHTIIKWLVTDYQPLTLSVSNDGQLLVISHSSPMLMLYGSDAGLIRSIQLPRNIDNPVHALKTSIGNFILLHQWKQTETEEDSGSSARQWADWRSISELTEDGQNVIRTFRPLNKAVVLSGPYHIALDSDDRVFVTDRWHYHVILLDYDLTLWNRTHCPIFDETPSRLSYAWRVCYDKEKRQLIVGQSNVFGRVNVYTLSRN